LASCGVLKQEKLLRKKTGWGSVVFTDAYQKGGQKKKEFSEEENISVVSNCSKMWGEEGIEEEEGSGGRCRLVQGEQF